MKAIIYEENISPSYFHIYTDTTFMIPYKQVTQLPLLRLKALQRQMQKHYSLYRLGKVSEAEYLCRIKPLDRQIDLLEMSILKGYFVWKEASSGHFRVQGTKRVKL